MEWRSNVFPRDNDRFLKPFLSSLKTATLQDAEAVKNNGYQ